MLENLIIAVNKLQDVFNTLSLKLKNEKIAEWLPQIVMVGAQVRLRTKCL